MTAFIGFSVFPRGIRLRKTVVCIPALFPTTYCPTFRVKQPNTHLASRFASHTARGCASKLSSTGLVCGFIVENNPYGFVVFWIKPFRKFVPV